jgi:hypothetical protein
MATSTRANSDAANDEDAVEEWRDWCAYLRSHLTLLELRAASANRTAFEREESGEVQEAAASAAIARIPAARRSLFMAIHEQRRQQMQLERERAVRTNGGSRRQLDPDAIDRDALNTLLDAAEGRSTADGWGHIPGGTVAEPQWFYLDVARVTDAPNAALYALGRAAASNRQQRIVLMGGVMVACVVLLVVWMLWPQGASIPARRSDGVVAFVNGTALEARWVPTILEVRSPATLLATLPISGTMTWNTPVLSAATEPLALWLVRQPWPLTLCVPRTVLAEASEVRIRSRNGAPERRYTLTTNAAQASDLRLDACADATSDQHRTRYGTLQSSTTSADLRLGARADLSETTQLTLREITIIGAGADPTLPVGQIRVVVKVGIRSQTTLDWPTLVPTLLLASGEALLPATTTPISAGMQLSYLAPVPVEVQEAVWSVLPPAQDRPIRWRIVLTPPPSRDQILRQMLRVSDLQAQVANAQITIRGQFINTGSVPLMISTTDMTVLISERPLSLPMLPELAEPLATGETRSFTRPAAGSRSSSAAIWNWCGAVSPDRARVTEALSNANQDGLTRVELFAETFTVGASVYQLSHWRTIVWPHFRP